MIVNQDKSERQLTLKSKKPLSIMQDSELLLDLNLHKISIERSKEDLPSPLRSLLSNELSRDKK